MLNPDSHKEDQRVIFPPQTSSLIIKLAEKYNIKETTTEMIEKINKGGVLNVTRIAKTVAAIAENKIPFNKIASVLQNELNLSPKIAKELENDLKKQILVLVAKPSSQKPSKEKTPIKKPPISKDAYRESAE